MKETDLICEFHLTLTANDYRIARLFHGGIVSLVPAIIVLVVLLALFSRIQMDRYGLGLLAVAVSAMVAPYVAPPIQRLFRPRGLSTSSTEIDVRCFRAEIEISSLDWLVRMPNEAITSIRKTKSQLLITYYDAMLFVIPRRAITDDVAEKILALEPPNRGIRMRPPFLSTATDP